MSASSGIGSTTVARWTSTSVPSSSGLSSERATSTRWNSRVRTRRRGGRTSRPTRRVTVRSAARTGRSRCPTTPDAPVMAIDGTFRQTGRRGGSPRPGDEPSLPFGFGNLDLNQLLRMLQASGPVNWEIATQVATHVATDGEPERPVDPSTAAQVEAGTRRVDPRRRRDRLRRHVHRPGARHGRRGWAELHLETLRPVLEALATTLGQAFGGGEADPSASGRPGADPLAGLLPMLAPLLLGVQAGSMIGYLAQHALGRYDLPLPAVDEPSLCFVVPNLDAFEEAGRSTGPICASRWPCTRWCTPRPVPCRGSATPRRSRHRVRVGLRG